MSLIKLTLEKELAERLFKALQKSLANAELTVPINKAKGEADEAVKYIHRPNTFLMFDRLVNKLYKKWCTVQARQLIDYYKGQLEERRRMGLTAKWVEKQEFTALDIIFRNPDVTMPIWYEAIDWFLADDYYKDKICGLCVIARNFHKFLTEKKNEEDPIYKAFMKATI